MINVLIVNDSPTAAELLSRLLEADPEIHVAALARNGLEAVDLAGRERPHVIAMDVHMPRMNGFDTTRRIMETSPVPIVIVAGSSSRDDDALLFKSVQSGAVACVRLPPGPLAPGHAEQARELVSTIKAMSEVKVVRRWPYAGDKAGAAPPAPDLRAAPETRAVAVGASTGGPVALQAILSRLPAGLGAPVVVVQHMSPGFMPSLAQWLAISTPLEVRIASHGETALPGRVYLAPDGRHLELDAGGRTLLADGPQEKGMRPSVSRLFRSAARSFGAHAAGILLTGMGEDGADGLKAMRDAGAVTIAQNRETSLIYGMPGAAVKADAAAYVLPPEAIAAAITRLIARGRNGDRYGN